MEKDVQEQPPASEDQPTQKTFKGYEIPVPTKREVMDFFKKAAGATPKKP